MFINNEKENDVFSDITGRLNDDYSWDEERILNIYKRMIEKLDRREEKGIKRYDNPQSDRAIKYAKKIGLYVNNCRILLDKVAQNDSEKFKLIKNRLQSMDSEAMLKIKDKLERKIVALKYRANSSLFGYDEGSDSEENFQILKKLGEEWKSGQKLAKDTTQLNELEILQLKEAAKYDKWIPLMQKDENYRKKFFRWAFDNHNPVKVFICCPLTRKRICDAILSSSIGVNRRVELDGKVTNEILKFDLEDLPNGEGQREVLTLPVFQEKSPRNGKTMHRYNILNPNGVIFFDQAKTISDTVKNIFEISGKKNENEVEYNFGAYGLFKGNPKEYYFEALKNGILVDDFYEDFMPTEIVSKDYLIELYGKQEAIVKGKVFFRIAGSYKGKGLGDTHGWLQIFVPDGDNFKVIDYGKFAIEYVMGWWAKYLAVAGTNQCVYIPFDQNGSMTHRRVTTVPIFTSEEETEVLLQKIKAQLQEVDVFQFATDKNCAANAEFLIRESLAENNPLKESRFFESNVFDGEMGFLEEYLSSLKDKHWVIQYLGIVVAMLVFAAWRTYELLGEVKNSVWRYYMDKVWEGQPVYLYGPALLANRDLPYTVTYYGNTERKLPHYIKQQGL